MLFQQHGYLRHGETVFYLGPGANIAFEGDTLVYDDTHPVNTVYFDVPVTPGSRAFP